jgi:Dyp-type peroxidase family
LELEQIQGNVVPGFSKDHQAFVFVRFQGADEARAWLSALQPHIASATEVQSFRAAFKSVRARAPHPGEPDDGALSHVAATWANVALSFAGLRLLLGAAASGRFPNVFRQNRVPGATALDGEVHALLILAADRADDLDAEVRHQRERMTSLGVREVKIFCGHTLPGDLRGHEHFGFKDAISQPRIAGTDWGNGSPVAPGEFVLGYPDQAGKVSGAGLPAWTRNGSFLAFVQLQQHVATFWNTMKQQAQQLGAQPEEVAAWIVGRHHDADGTLLTDPPARVSHIGRAYARWLPPDEAQRHRILRRGIPYGPPWTAGESDTDQERGILFVTYQADIERQFEHVWSQWLNSPNQPIPSAGRDALVGQPAAPSTGASPPWTSATKRPAVAARPGQRGGMVSLSLPQFVTPLYGGYFFTPATDMLSALKLPNLQARYPR